jgi:plasmid stabilization system protein ParE
MKVVYAPRALRSPRGAHNVSVAIEHTVDMCALNPRTGAKTDEPSVRRRSLGRYRYAIFYRMLAGGEGIEIARVVHSARVNNLGKLPEDE